MTAHKKKEHKKESEKKATRKKATTKKTPAKKPKKKAASKKAGSHHFVRKPVEKDLSVDIEKELNRVVHKAEERLRGEQEETEAPDPFVTTDEPVVEDLFEDDVDEVVEDVQFEVAEDDMPEEKAPAKPKKRRKKAAQHEDDIDEALEDIYKNNDGSLPDMKQFTKRKRGRFIRAMATLLFACAFLAAVFWVGLFILQPGDNFSEEDIILTVSAEEQVRIGDDVHFRIRYVNAQKTALSQASLQVRFPEGFVFKESSQSADSERNDTWSIGALSEDESGYIDVYGTLYGNADQEQSMRVFFTYTPENFSSEFQKVATVTVATSKSPVRLEIDGPEEVVAGSQQPLRFVIDIEEGAEFSGPIALEVLPDGQFIKKSQNLENEQFEEFRWTLPTDNQHTELALEGTFVPGPEQEKASIPIRIIGWQDEARSGEAYVLADELLEVALINEDVVVSAVINGANSNLQVQPGDVLNMSISLRNSGDVAIDDINIQAILDAPSFNDRSILHWNDLVDPADGDIRGEQINDSMRRGVISWNKRHVTPLTRLGPSDEILIDVSIPIRNAEQTALANFEAFQANVSIDVQYNVDGKLQTASTKPINLSINSDLELDVRDQIARAGDSEEHTITWLLSNSFHDLADIRLSAEVYGNTSLDDARLVVPAGSASFDNETKRLSWTIDAMPVSIDVLPLQFTLVRNDINPSQTQLMSKVELRATDTKTGEDIIIVGDEISLAGE